MRETLIAATEAALRNVGEIRFFQTERGFQGRFYCALQAQLDEASLTVAGTILEMEYQKSSRHGVSQRPDIIFHVPTEHSGVDVTFNNFAVWALKRRATITDAQDDFEKLDKMFNDLNYPLGFFVNIDSTDPMRAHYTGTHGSRLQTVAAMLNGSHVTVRWGQSAEA